MGNVLYAALFGWIIAGAYMAAMALLWASGVGRPYAALCHELARYYFWPFGKYLTVGHPRILSLSFPNSSSSSSWLLPLLSPEIDERALDRPARGAAAGWGVLPSH